jgi:MFS family permease
MALSVLSFGPSSIFLSDRKSLVVLFFISFLYLLEQFDRSLISVSPIPYIDYGSYEYSVLAGPAFTIVYTFGGVVFALFSYKDPVSIKEDALSNSASTAKFHVLSLATFVFSAAFLLTAFARTFWGQLFIRVIMGLAQSVITPFSSGIISDYFAPIMRGAAFGIFNLGTYVSFSLSLSLGIYIYIAYGWRAGYLLFGAVGICFALAMPLFTWCDMKRAYKDETTDIADTSQNDEDNSQVDVSRNDFEVGNCKIQPKEVSFNPLKHHPTKGNSRLDSMDFASVSDRESKEKGGEVIPDARSRWRRLLSLAWEICWDRWGSHPGVYTLVLATGVRIGAGYVWVAYTGAFFSDTFTLDTDSSCSYSYNSDFSTDHHSDMCGNDFPYCVSGGCNKLTSFPWHNKVCMYLFYFKYLH